MAAHNLLSPLLTRASANTHAQVLAVAHTVVVEQFEGDDEEEIADSATSGETDSSDKRGQDTEGYQGEDDGISYQVSVLLVQSCVAMAMAMVEQRQQQQQQRQ